MMDYPQSLIRYPHTNNSLLSSGNAKKASTYEPRTEAISPAINDDIINAEDSSSKSTKDEQTLLVEKLKKVEAEIIQTDLQIVRLRRQKEQLEQAASSHNRDDDDQENVCDTKQLSIAKLVYHENRAKAQRAHSKLDCLGGCPRDLPIYNQPSDNTIYHQNVAKFNTTFKENLISCFRERLTGRISLEESVSSEYDRRMEKWLKKIEAEDSQPSKRIKDAKTREFFEKQFPELKKARESGERFSRVGQRVARSDAEVAELLDGITEREDQDKKVKSYAVIPPMLEEMRTKKPKFINTNGYVEDLMAEYKEHQILNIWTDEEKEIFKENYLQHPKDFGLIARMTTRKTVADCVQYYYLSKKSENYKQLLKRQQKRRTRSFVRPAQSTPAANTTAVENNQESNKASDANNCGKQGGDSIMTDITNAAEQNDCSKTSAFNAKADEGENNAKNSDGSSQENTSCCVCNCNFSDNNQFRNVTRSNHQLYGIGRDALKPGLKICYPCRFRHVKHPSFDEPYVSPEPMECQEDIQHTEMMDIDTPVIKAETRSFVDPQPINNDSDGVPVAPVSNPSDLNQPQQILNPEPSDYNKGPKRTCVRDIIYQAIEMSFQKPKESTEAMDIKQEPVRTDGLITTPMNPILPPHPIMQNVLPPKPIVPNHPMMQMPMSAPVGIHPNLALRQQMQERHFLQLRQQQFQMQQQHHHQQQQQQQHHQAQQQAQQAQQQAQQHQQRFRQQQLKDQVSQHLHQTANLPPPHLQPPTPHHLITRHPNQPLLSTSIGVPPLRQVASQPSLIQPLPNHTLLTTTVPIPPLSTPTVSLAPAQNNLGHTPMSQVPGMPTAHPLNLCRKYSDPVFIPEPTKGHPKNRPPPMAHSGKSQSSRGGNDDGCVLNLSAKYQSPAPTPPAPLQTVMPQAAPIHPTGQPLVQPVATNYSIIQQPQATINPITPPKMPSPPPAQQQQQQSQQLRIPTPPMPQQPKKEPEQQQQLLQPKKEPSPPATTAAAIVPPVVSVPAIVPQSITQTLISTAISPPPAPKESSPPAAPPTGIEKVADNTANGSGSSNNEGNVNNNKKDDDVKPTLAAPPPPPPQMPTAPLAKKSPEYKSEPISPPASAQSSSPTAKPVQSPPPTDRDESRSPNFTGSPTSPSEMVIDESADVGSPSSSSSSEAEDEKAKGE